MTPVRLQQMERTNKSRLKRLNGLIDLLQVGNKYLMLQF